MKTEKQEQSTATMQTNNLSQTNNLVVAEPLLKFGAGSAKLDKKIATFSLPSGYTCPFAEACKAFASKNLITGKVSVKDASGQKFRCYSASLEALRPALYNLTRYNFNLLKDYLNKHLISGTADLIVKSVLATKKNFIRVHVSGDFFNEKYFLAWMLAAEKLPEKTFYAYTKSIPFVVKYKAVIPDNFIITASRGGKFDNLIGENNLKNVRVVFSPEEAESLNLKIDHDDSLAMDKNVKEFALLVHGVQPKNSDSAKAIKFMVARNIKFSYGVKRKS